MRPIAPVLALLLVCAASARAQSVDIDGIRDRLAKEQDIPALKRLSFSLNRHAATLPEAMLERGMVQLRLYQLTRDDDDVRMARDMFERAAKKLPPNDARVYYGRGLARMGGPGVRIPLLSGVVLAQSMAEIVKRDPVSLAKNDFKRALELQPGLSGAAIELAHLSLATHDKSNLEAAAASLRGLTASGTGGVEAAIALSEVEEALGNVPAAAKAAEVATDLSAGSDGSGAASAAHARAVALLRQPAQEAAGGRAYFAGVDQLNDESAAVYYRAVAAIVTDRERQEWNSAGINFRQEWLKRFWAVRAASSGVTVSERMAEHFKRLAVAQDKYRKQGKRGAAPGGSLVQQKYKADDLPFDDRGIIYVRHGAPAEVVRTSDVDLRPNETWVYHVNGRNQLYNFVVLRDGTDYRLVDDLLAALDPSTRGVPTEAAAKLLRDRQAYEPRYAAIAQKYDNYDRAARMAEFAAGASMNENAQSINTAQTRIAADMRAQALVALATDSDSPNFTGDLPFYYDLYAFKGANGVTDITAAAAIPGTSLFSQRQGNQYIYALQASLIFIDTLTSEVVRKDSVFTFWSSRVLGEHEHLRITMDVSVPIAKTGIHRIVLRDLSSPGVGQLYGGPSDIRNFTSPSLMMSDLVLAESEDGKWHRGLANLGLVPPRQFEKDAPVKIFYEVYNLPAETPYRTEITMAPVAGITGFGRLKKLMGAKGRAIALHFDATAQPNADGTVQELRQVTAQVKPGKYRIEVRVTNLQNQQSTRTETVFLVSPQPKRR